MALVQCPSCSNRVSHLAAACPRCGYPIAVPPPPPRSSTSTGVVLLVVALVGGLGVVGVMGILAALAIPRFSRAVDRARESGAQVELQEIYDLEQVHLASTGAYTANLSDPEGEDYLAGWDGPPTGDYDYSVSLAAGGGLCVEAVPAAHLPAGARVISMDAEGTQYRGASCSGEPIGAPGVAPVKPVGSEPVAAEEAAATEEAVPAEEEAPSGRERITSEGVYDPAVPGAKPSRAEKP